VNTGKRPRHRPVDLVKREAILDAARDEFFAHGFAAASIETIAEASKVSKVTIYNRFVTKEALFAAMVERECKIMGTVFFAPDNDAMDLRSQLIAFGQTAINFLTERHIMRFERRLGAEAEQRPEVGELFLNAGPRRLKKELTKMLEAAVASKSIRPCDCGLAAGHLYGLICGFDMFFARFSAKGPNKRKLKAQIPEAVDRFLEAYRI
jgi:TetR/AcrR family transcriptional regulator, mexJK operon transcriptional repressor